MRKNIKASHLSLDARDFRRIERQVKYIDRHTAKIHRLITDLRKRDEAEGHHRAGPSLGLPDIIDVPWGSRFAYPDRGIVIDAIHDPAASYLDVVDGEVDATYVVRWRHGGEIGKTKEGFRKAERLAQKALMR